MDGTEVTGLVARAAALQRVGATEEVLRVQHEIVDVAAVGVPLRLAGPDIVCTLGGGTDAMRERIDQWRAVLERCTGRLPAEGGLTLVFDHDAGVTVELARLGAAEFECCSFFTFALVVDPAGVRFTATAPVEAADVVTALFGTPDPAVV